LYLGSSQTESGLDGFIHLKQNPGVNLSQFLDQPPAVYSADLVKDGH
jgi:hypothetical protein